jgi:hypothetical protein
MQVKNHKYIIAIIVTLASGNMYSMFPINLYRAWDINLRPPIWCGENFQWTAWVENGYKAHAYNDDGIEKNVAQIWNTTQDALAMLQGFDPSSPVTQFFENVLQSPEDNGIRGHFKVDADFKAKAFGFAWRYHCPYNFTLGLHLPFYDMQLKNITFTDQTQNVSMSDMIVREELTSQLVNRVAEFDPSLNLYGWSKLGIGDLFFIADWYRDFPQGKPILKHVALNARAALSIPTGVKVNVDDILSIPYGFDGSVGFIFGGGINLVWFDVFRGGLDVEFIQLFGNTRERRIKVQEAQTEFLLLSKTEAHKDFGITQRFNLFLEGYRVVRGLSARATYQFWKHGEDKLTLCTNAFSNDIANTAQSLQEWTMHQVIFELSYDFQCDIPKSSPFKPQFSLFYKLPFNGERALLLNTVGATFSLNF